MAICGLVVCSALVLAVRWRNYAFVLDARTDAPWSARLRGLARVLAIGYLTGLVTGILFIGPAGRLAMRLLAATSPDAQGQKTEAGEVVGKITVEGTAREREGDEAVDQPDGYTYAESDEGDKPDGALHGDLAHDLAGFPSSVLERPGGGCEQSHCESPVGPMNKCR